MSDSVQAQTSVEVQTLVEQIVSEGPIGLTAAAKLLGSFREGRPTHPSTLARHHLRGVRLADGSVLHLEAIRIAGRLVTSRAAVLRFIAGQQPTGQTAVSAVPQSPAARNRAASAASKELDELGI